MTPLILPIEVQLTAKSQALLNALRKIDQVPAAAEPAAPSAQLRIGDRYQDGIYAGLSRGEDGQPDAHLVLLDAVPEGKLNWKDALKWAEGLGNDARLPTRFESALLYANVREQMNTDDWHWTLAQTSAGFAWVQDFDDGFQLSNGKSITGRARAVRRLNSLVL